MELFSRMKILKNKNRAKDTRTQDTKIKKISTTNNQITNRLLKVFGY